MIPHFAPLNCLTDSAEGTVSDAAVASAWALAAASA
jgi:hypothetical protein